VEYTGDEMWLVQQFSGVRRISRPGTGRKSLNKQLLVANILYLHTPFAVDCTMKERSQCGVYRGRTVRSDPVKWEGVWKGGERDRWGGNGYKGAREEGLRGEGKENEGKGGV
jgi:hypothetical protein